MAGNIASVPTTTASINFDPQSTAKLYAPQHEREPYKNTSFVRDIAYGTRPRNQLDVATSKAASGTTRPVLIFVPGGPGNRTEVAGYLFYDNVLLWAVAQGYVGVNMSRDSGAETSWDTGAKNIGAVIQWVQNNIKQYGGDPNRIFIWGHSMGATALAAYLSHPEYYPQGEIGLRGAILHSGSYNIAPIVATQPGRTPASPPPDPAVLLTQSSLPGLQKTTLPLLLAAADGDPLDRPEYVTLLHDALCKAGHCPTTLSIKNHDHFSEIFAVNTADQSVSKPVLEWLHSIDAEK
ncbi:MAG: alpha/beta hydrolase [Steroidobacteraceae bacterium]